MSIALPWLLQRQPSARLGRTLRRHVLEHHITRVCPRPQTIFQPSPLSFRAGYATIRKRSRDDNARTGRWSQAEKRAYDEETTSTSHGVVDSNLKNPEVWIRQLERYLPRGLRTHGLEGHDQGRPGHASPTSAEILSILHAARKSNNAHMDILAHMLVGSRKKAALWICDLLLKDLASRMPGRSAETPPSNILWPKESFYAMTGRSITVNTVTHSSAEICDQWDHPTRDPRYSFALADEEGKIMAQIWYTLGAAVVRAADMEGEDAERAMNAVHLVLGQIHNLDLVPDHVYSYQVSPLSTTAQKPPIIHLVSSRILAALSDATWRDQQLENIERATSHGLSLEQIGRDPPGGRFRLKVRPLDPEVWLEFILWCCVEGGFASVGARIINLLEKDTKDPWFAATWTDGNGIGQMTPHIDWDRVKTRTGGTVGRLEAYSTVKPLAEMPPRTVSTEVVLALVEAHIDAVRRAPGSSGLTLDAAQRGVVSLISFLEPHDLPVPYFDYISARFSLSEALDTDAPGGLKKWFDKLAYLKSLKPVRSLPRPRVSFQLDALLMHSEFTAGLLHQVLESFIRDGNTHESLKVFNDLQELVDNSKLHAISSFLRSISPRMDDFFSPHTFEGNPDFVDSHGQLPLYKIAGVLNLATDTNLIGFGQWLLYNDDPDGPLVPRTAYGSSAIARALVRFAALSHDAQLLESVSARHSMKRLPTVNYLRTMLDARLSLLDFPGAAKVMRQLNSAQGGGFGLVNLAGIGALVLKLENNPHRAELNSTDPMLRHAKHLLSVTLLGKFAGVGGVLQQSVRTTFKQQVAHLLTLFAAFPESELATFARSHYGRFRAGNVPNLPPSAFNSFLEAVIKTKGAKAGMDFVDSYCVTSYKGDSVDNLSAEDMTRDQELEDDVEAEELPDRRFSPARDSDTDSSQAFIPFVSELLNTDAPSLSESESPVDDPELILHENEATADTALNTPHQVPKDELPFKSPFFPKPEQAEAASTVKHKAEDPQLRDLDHGPVCIHDARTIRLIVREANRNYNAARPGSQEADIASAILKWARLKFRALGYSPHMIANEIRAPMVEAADSRLKSQVKTTPKTWRPLDQGEHRPSSRISNSFQGRNVMNKKRKQAGM